MVMDQWPKSLGEVETAGRIITRIVAFFAKSHQDHVAAAKTNGLILRDLDELSACSLTMSARGNGHPPDLQRGTKMRPQGYKSDTLA